MGEAAAGKRGDAAARGEALPERRRADADCADDANSTGTGGANGAGTDGASGAGAAVLAALRDRDADMRSLACALVNAVARDGGQTWGAVEAVLDARPLPRAGGCYPFESGELNDAFVAVHRAVADRGAVAFPCGRRFDDAVRTLVEAGELTSAGHDHDGSRYTLAEVQRAGLPVDAAAPWGFKRAGDMWRYWYSGSVDHLLAACVARAVPGTPARTVWRFRDHGLFVALVELALGGGAESSRYAERICALEALPDVKSPTQSRVAEVSALAKEALGIA